MLASAAAGPRVTNGAGAPYASAVPPAPPISTTVILCRHGESEGNRERRFGGQGPTPLTVNGRAQALATGQALARTGVDLIYTSDLPRAAETAALISQAMGVTPEATTALRERSVGQLTGLTFDEARIRFPEGYAALLRRDLEVSPPGGESVADCRLRAVTFLGQALARHQGARILLVSHYVTLHMLIRHVVGLEGSAIGSSVAFQVDNCALHRLEWIEASTWKVVALNERAHLAGA
jgi:probable phosphoglycerate mutase